MTIVESEMSNKATGIFSRMTTLFARRFVWVCAGTLAGVGIVPHANAAISQAPSAQPGQVNSIQERLRVVRERLGTEELQRIGGQSHQSSRFAQWYSGR